MPRSLSPRGERGLGEAGAARGGDGPDVEDQLDSGGLELVEELRLGLAFIADGEQRCAPTSPSKSG